MQERIGPYRIVRKLGEGGMGVVYAAHDERLGRAVAIKCIRDAADALSRERFLREARAAAGVNHPNICQLFDIGENEGIPFLVMELLQGESLSDRVARGALPLADAIGVCLGILTALEALHGRGFVHRDLKPSNVFSTATGVKLLDFGLAREFSPLTLSPDATTLHPGQVSPVTAAGMILGTPRYMAPEQLLGGPVDARADLFAAGSILYEMISGSSPFSAESPMTLFHAIAYENAPHLAGSAAIAAVNRIIHRAMAKRADDRYQSAANMAKDLRESMMISDVGGSVTATRVTRLIVIPFRILRSDAETDFLAYAVPEAITTSLANVRSLIVRSSAAAARFASDAIDLKKLAEEADVDVALTGTILRAGEQIRVTTQLVEVPAGTVLWSSTSQSALADLFELQDKLTQRIVESLQIPLTDREARVLRHDVPANPRAHEFYLRATQLGESESAWKISRDLLQRAIEEDPLYAPAWARLARIHLLLGKYGDDSKQQYQLSESAARRALDLNPDLAAAHHAYAHLEVATGRAQQSLVRLLDRVNSGSNDPAVFAALVTSLRYCGLLSESAAAHEQARQLDPTISTSASHTYWMLGRYDEAMKCADPERGLGSDAAFILESKGDLEGALRVVNERENFYRTTGSRDDWIGFRVMAAFRAALENQADEAVRRFSDLRDFADPEGLFYMGRAISRVGRAEAALDWLERAERGGFFCYPLFVSDPWLDPLRGDSRFLEIVQRVKERNRSAQQTFEAHPGSRVLGVGLKR